MNPFDTFLINPILNLLVIFLKVFQTLGIPQALGLSIILLTAVVRLAIWPLTSSAGALQALQRTRSQSPCRLFAITPAAAGFLCALPSSF